jgi:hypothetical protein
VTVVVITPRQIKNLRSRYGSAGNKDDRFDAYVLADVLPSDRARLRPLIPDSPATATLRQACRARQDLVRHRVAVGNQLRAHLLCAFPGAAGLFGKLHSAIGLAFLARFNCQDRADWLEVGRVGAAAVAGGLQPGGQAVSLIAPSQRFHREQPAEKAERHTTENTEGIIGSQPCFRPQSQAGRPYSISFPRGAAFALRSVLAPVHDRGVRSR